MPAYRMYFLDAEGRVFRPPEILECADDQEAIEQAKKFVDGLDIEVWESSRVVAKIPRR